MGWGHFELFLCFMLPFFNQFWIETLGIFMTGLTPRLLSITADLSKLCQVIAFPLSAPIGQHSDCANWQSTNGWTKVGDWNLSFFADLTIMTAKCRWWAGFFWQQPQKIHQQKGSWWFKIQNTVCPRSSDPFYIVLNI